MLGSQPRSSLAAELLARPETKAPSQHEFDAPDDVIRHALYFLRPCDVARASAVCRRWRRVGADELVWKRLCKRTLDLFIPESARSAAEEVTEEERALALEDAAEEAAAIAAADALAAAEAAEEEPGRVVVAAEARGRLALALGAGAAERRARLAELAAVRSAAAAERERIAAARGECVDYFRSRAQSLGSFRKAFVFLPQLHFLDSGGYCLHQEYCRQGVRDMFHMRPDILRAVFCRCFWFRSDRTLLYSLMTGQPHEAARELRRLLSRLATQEASEAAAVAADAAAAAHTARTLALLPSAATPPAAAVPPQQPQPPPTPPASRAALLSRSKVLGFSTSRAEGVERTVGRGTWAFEGRFLLAEVTTSSSTTTWRLEVCGGDLKRLRIAGMSMRAFSDRAGSAPTPITQLNDEELVFLPLPIV